MQISSDVSPVDYVDNIPRCGAKRTSIQGTKITHVGGYINEQWKITKEAAIGMIERREWEFYTMANGHRAEVIVASRDGRKYLKTTADYDTPDNLLSLPECP
jgi:hypothetical protein